MAIQISILFCEVSIVIGDEATTSFEYRTAGEVSGHWLLPFAPELRFSRGKIQFANPPKLTQIASTPVIPGRCCEAEQVRNPAGSSDSASSAKAGHHHRY